MTGGKSVNYLPILIDIRNQDVLVVGEGHLAARKARGALRAGAKVTFLGTIDSPALDAIVGDANCRHLDENFTAGHLRGMRLVFAATEDETLAKTVSRAAREAGIPVNVADRTALCSFIMPATVTRGPIVVAVSSGGDAPILTRSLRARLETMLPASLGTLAGFVAERRQQVMNALPDFDSRRRFWDRFMDGPIPEQITAGDLTGAERLFETTVAEISSPGGNLAGTVALIGCGPGDPDMLTFKALRLMQQADIAVIDPGVSEGIADRVRRDAEIVTVGSADTLIGLPNSIVTRMADWIEDGKSVVRLGHGNFPASDQGLREAAALSEVNIRAIIVDGVTSNR